MVVGRPSAGNAIRAMATARSTPTTTPRQACAKRRNDDIDIVEAYCASVRPYISTVHSAFQNWLRSIRGSIGASQRQMTAGVKLGNRLSLLQIAVCQPASANIAFKSLLRKLS